MSSLSLYTLTDAGRRIQALVEAGSAMFKFTRMKLGDGEATSPSDYATLTDLIHPVYTGLFSTATARDNTVRMSMTVSNASISSALTVRELGIFVEDPEDAGGNDVLFAVSIDSNPETIPAGSSSSYTVRTYKASIHISDTSNITAVVDPAGLVTAEDVEDMYATHLIAMSPAHYERNEPWTGGASATRTSVESPAYMTVNINDKGYVLHEQQTLDIDTAAVWDDTSVTDYTVPANRAGKDFYIFVCVPSSGTTPDIVISANDTIPEGYTADNSRKIGGFHCISDPSDLRKGDVTSDWNDFPLPGYIEGDVIPASVWDLKKPAVKHPAATHNCFYRGKDLTAYFDSGEMSAAIADGNFKDIYPGDYIIKTVTIDGVTYADTKFIVMDLDYFCPWCFGDSGELTHHLVMMPEGALGTKYMNSTNIVTGSYVGSYMHATHIPKVNAGIVAAFGSAHILMHRDYLANAVDTSNNAISGAVGTWRGCSTNWAAITGLKCCLCSENMVYGGRVGGNFFDTGCASKQFAAFRHNQQLRKTTSFWLRAVTNSATFAYAHSYGLAGNDSASLALGVRPYFLLA